MELSYFEEAIDFLMKQQMIKTDKGIGICGISKGADIALTLSAILSPSKLGAIAVLNTLISSAVVGATYQGRTVTKALQLKMSEGSLKEVSPYVLNLYEMFRGDAVSEDTFIPFFNTKVPILFIAGKDDQFYPSLEQAQIAEKIMKRSGKLNFKLSSYEGLGHLIDAPFAPSTPLSNHPLFPKPYLVQMGGTDPIKHGRAQEQVWKELVKYFSTNL